MCSKSEQRIKRKLNPFHSNRIWDIVFWDIRNNSSLEQNTPHRSSLNNYKNTIIILVTKRIFLRTVVLSAVVSFFL